MLVKCDHEQVNVKSSGVPQKGIESGQLSTTCINPAEVAIWATPSCSRPQPAKDNGVRDGRSNWLVLTTTLMDSTTERLVHSINRCKAMPGINVKYEH